MKYTVLLSRQAEKFYRKLEEELKAQVRECLIGLENSAYQGKRLHGDLKDNYSLRVRKLRIIYTISEKDEIVYVVAIGPRKKVYR